MSDKMRWRYGDTSPVTAAVDASTVIEIGDLLWLDVNNAKPASRLPDQGTEMNNQLVFQKFFLGVAMQRSRNGDTAEIRVATTGVFEFDCTSDTFELGDWVGGDENATGNALLNQQLVKVEESRLAIGRVARREPVATTRALIDIRSTKMTGGVEGTTAEET